VGTKAAASASAAGDYMPLTALDAEAVCHLLTTMGKQIGKYHAAFADCEINGFQLNGLKEKSQLEELSIKMPDLVFQDLMHRINDVKIIQIMSISCRSANLYISHSRRQLKITGVSRALLQQVFSIFSLSLII
jgi:hypothetical protein